MRNAVRRMLIVLLAMSLVACNNLSEEERRSQDALAAVGSAVPLSAAVAQDGMVFFWTGELKGGEAVVLQIPPTAQDGRAYNVFAFWVGNGQVYPVNQASHDFMEKPPTASAPVTLKEVIDAIEDLPPGARVELEKGTQ